MDRPTLLLQRLDDIGRSLASEPTALALIGLGSVGRELSRLDDYSDLDFFVIVESEHKQRYIDNLAWLEAAHPLAYTFRNSVDGYKFLFADGIYGEMAVFGPEELANAAYAPGRMVWRRADMPQSAASPAHWPPRRSPPSLDHLLGEALTNLYVGLGRFRRGEKLSAFRFIQGYAVDRVVDLAQRMASQTAAEEDHFDGPRRFERRFPDLAGALPALMPGYEHSPEAAAAILSLLSAHFEIDPAIRDAIIAMLDS
ncbi:MAG: hypothetical protein KC410_06090 [Anaerolineales bacterium]|uniref:hypothetical protein n=1 Tax=Promineifilum sp. TaxID=2664178 RepID=UPI001D20791D|nr:hypothetical protein [Anaerolineales bacterium]MCB8935409.1 hypothetical protein [Promineifilum sp.]MCO5181559.1 hypothetical protein [Promineifilum sp.]